LIILGEWRLTMAQKLQTLYIDDIDGGEAEGTVRFGLDGIEYEIDLSSAHTAELRQVFTAYIAHGRKVGAVARRAPQASRRGTAPGGIDTAAVRAWAKDQGVAINDRGRIPGKVVAQYREATGQ
jgi:hypothetical protein